MLMVVDKSLKVLKAADNYYYEITHKSKATNSICSLPKEIKKLFKYLYVCFFKR